MSMFFYLRQLLVPGDYSGVGTDCETKVGVLWDSSSGSDLVLKIGYLDTLLFI